MENKQRSKLYSILLSVVIAFGLWMYVVNNVSEIDENTFYNIPVVVEGEGLLNERNLMITGKSAETMSVMLSGARSDLNKLDSSNLSVKIDVSKIMEPGEKHELKPTISYPVDASSKDYTEENFTPSIIYVNVDTRRTREIPVEVKWTGTRSSDYIYDTENYTLDYSAVTVIGPAAVADLIDHAEIEVDLTGKVESISESFRYTLCDAQDNPVDAAQITTNVEEIRLDAQIHRIKELTLAVHVNYGGGANESNTDIEILPETIRVSGGDAVLAELGDSLNIATINMAEQEKTHTEQTITITLPEGVTNQTGVTEAKVTIRISGVTTKEFTIENFNILNVPEGMEAEIINANLVVKVRGPSSVIAMLDVNDMIADVDFSAAEAGTAYYKATIRFAEGFEALGAMKTYSVSATVQEKE